MGPKRRRRNHTNVEQMAHVHGACGEDPKFVVAIDFGTTFSKAAYAEAPHLQPGVLELDTMVHLITDWPGQEAGAGAKVSKTKTCVWYVPGTEQGTLEFKAWGWEAYVGYKKVVQSLDVKRNTTSSSSDQALSLSNKRGHLIDGFKLGLYDKTLEEELPQGLSLLEVISNFLSGVKNHILRELRGKHGSHVLNSDIKWCITVPALWEENHRQSMEDCAELAGLVLGPLCTDATASPHDLITVLEPEAASIYCHNTLRLLSKGDTFAVVDLGGGTSDLVTHKRIGSTRRSNVRVREVSESAGGLCGGVHVDEKFLEYLRCHISTPTTECFAEFEKLHPVDVLDMLIHWGRIKASYEGEVEYCKQYELNIPRPLAKRWKQSHKKYLQSAAYLDAAGDNVSGAEARPRKSYDQILLRSTTVKQIFDEDIELILGLIERRDIDNVDYVLIVGGFSESPYVRKRILERFCSTNYAYGYQQLQQEKTSKIIFPRNADTAVVRGAVALGVLGEWESFVKSRIAKKTYGFDTSVPFDKLLHPAAYMVQQDGTNEKLCDHVFEAFIRRGEEVPFNSVVDYDTTPLYREGFSDDDNIEITLYSTTQRNPKYVLERGVKKEATCAIAVPKAVGSGDQVPQLRIQVHFGGTRIRLIVWGTNFSGDCITMPPVRLNCTALNHGDDDQTLQLDRTMERRLRKRANACLSRARV